MSYVATVTPSAFNIPVAGATGTLAPGWFGAGSFTDGTFVLNNAVDATKQLNFALGSQTTGTELTLASFQTTSQTLQFPNITATDTLATLGLAQTFAAVQTFTSVPVFSAGLGAGSFTSVTTGVGAVGTPSVNFTGDLTTGFFRPSSGQLGFVSAGVQSCTFASTYFMFSANTSVAIGSAPITSLNTGFSVHGADGAAAGYGVATYAGAPTMQFRRAGGTAAVPTAVALNDTLMINKYVGYTGAAFSSSWNGYGVFASEAWTATANGFHHRWYTIVAGGVVNNEVMRLHDSGALLIGQTTTDTINKLQVNGGASFGVGAVGAPSMTFAGHLTTGMYFQSGPGIAFACNGVQVLALTTNQFTFSENTSVLLGTAPITSIGVGTFHGVDGVQANNAVCGYGGTPGMLFRRAEGTAAAMTGVLSGSVLANFFAAGYTSATAFSSNTLFHTVTAAETWSATATGFRQDFFAGIVGTTTTVNALRLLGNGQVFIGGVANPTANTFPGPIIYGRNNAAADNAGALGETLTQAATGAAVGANGVTANITSQSLTSGKWLAYLQIVIKAGTTGLTAGSTVQASITSTTAGTGTSGDTMTQFTVPGTVAVVNGIFTIQVNAVEINQNATVTYFATLNLPYAAGTPTADYKLKFVRTG